VHQVLAGEGLDRVMPSAAQPGIERVGDALANQGGFEDASVEQNVGGASRPSPAAYGAAFGRAGACWRRKRASLASDGGIGGVGQSDFLQAGAALEHRHLGAGDGPGRKPSPSTRSISSRVSVGLGWCRHEAGAHAQNVNGLFLWLGTGFEQLLLGRAAVVSRGPAIGGCRSSAFLGERSATRLARARSMFVSPRAGM